MGYEFKTAPMPHQRRIFEETKDEKSHAIFWEQGTGKTKATIDILAHQFEKRTVDALLIIAPGGVHANWVDCESESDQEIDKHLPDHIHERMLSYTYQTKKAKLKREIPKMEAIIKHDGLSVLAMTYDSVMTANGYKFVKRFLERRSVFMVLDESHRIKTPGAKRTKRILSLGLYATSRRILTGTPLANSPFDIYTPIKFLVPLFWKDKDIPNFHVFQTYYGVWEKRVDRESRNYDVCVSYRHLDQLYEYIQGISDRVTKDLVLPDLPPRTYTKFYVDLSPEQRKLYDTLKKEFIVFLESGETITADLAMTRILRLQQVVCGYVPVDGGDEPDTWIAKDNPRMRALLDLLKDTKNQTIIYARFRRDIDAICDALGDDCVRYDGKIDIPDRPAKKEAFQNGDVQFFVGNPAVCGEGIDLFAGRTAIYYSNSFKLVDRLQSEARPHRKGQKNAVNYIDIVAPGTVDESIISALRSKLDISKIVLGDEFRSSL